MVTDYPTRKEALKLFDEFKVPANIRNHCIAVSAVAVVLAKKIKETGVDVDVSLCEFGGLFHDFMKAIKIPPLERDEYFKCDPSQEEIEMQKKLKERFSEMHETKATYLVLKDIWPRVAAFITTLNEYQSDGTVNYDSIEKKIVIYADMRCFLDEVWPFENRVNEFIMRNKKRMEENGHYEGFLNHMDQIRKIEKELFSDLDINPDDVSGLVQKQKEEWDND